MRVSQPQSGSIMVLNGCVHVDTTNPLLGSSVVVYRGTLRPKETIVAVRVHRYTVRGDEEGNNRVIRTIHTWFSLEHENIIPLLGIITEDESKISMVSPWMERGIASDYVQDKGVDPRPLLLGIAKGMRYLHNHKSGPIVHGSLKGTNVFISTDGRPQITAFSCSFSCCPISEKALSCTCESTMRWLAPEQIDNRTTTVEGDVWAFAMTGLELFTRAPPFHSIQGNQGVIIRVMRGPPDRPSYESTCSRMTDAWWKLLLECWAADALSRPPMSSITRTIESILEG